MAKMGEKWFYVLQVFVYIVLEIRGDEEVEYQGTTPVDPIKEMLARFDKSPWTVFAIESTTSFLEKQMRQFLEDHADLDDMEREMRIHGIIPDYLDLPPEQHLEVLHYNKELDYLQPLHMAEIYKPTLTMELPTLRYKVKKNATYIHMCVDPDHIVSRYEPEIDSSDEELWPTTTDDYVDKTFVHYLRGNIPHDNITYGTGDTIVEYLPPHPPNGTGLHRYMWLVYEQPHHYINFTEKFIPSSTAYERDWFKLRNFVRKYNLTLPVAAHFYYARFDESVPYIYAGLDDVLI